MENAAMAATTSGQAPTEPTDLDVLRCHVEITETLLALIVCTSTIERVEQIADGMKSLRATLSATDAPFVRERINALDWYINTVERAREVRRPS